MSQVNRRDALKLVGAAALGGMAVASVSPIRAQAASSETLIFRKAFTVTGPGKTASISIPDRASALLVFATLTACDPTGFLAVNLEFIDAFGFRLPVSSVQLSGFQVPAAAVMTPNLNVPLPLTPTIDIAWVLGGANASFNLSVYAR
jgi:hypothetical protein